MFFSLSSLNWEAVIIDRIKRIHERVGKSGIGKSGTKRFNIMSSYLTLKQKRGFGSEFKGRVSNLKYR